MKKSMGITAIVMALLILVSFPLNALALSSDEILRKGDNNQYVVELQKALISQGYLQGNPTGYYGTETENAVIAFQKAKRLKADGKAGPETRKALLGSGYKAITGSKNAKPAADEMRSGDKGDDVTELQQFLQKLGYYKYDKITGYYGPTTQDAVARFQRTNGLGVTGIADAKTIALLKSGSAKYYTIYYKDKGDDVKEMQQRLAALGYLKGSATGYFGSVTLTALKSFQKVNGLKADGKAGKNTLELLYSDKAKKASAAVKQTEPKKDDPKPDVPAPTPVVKTKVQKLIDYAKKYIGKKYQRGAEGPSKFDCSGFVLYCTRYVGFSLPRTSINQSKMTQYAKITKISDLKAGDLVFFQTHTRPIGHVGIYIGNNQFIHCAPGVGVQIKTFVKGSYYYTRFRWGRRIF